MKFKSLILSLLFLMILMIFTGDDNMIMYITDILHSIYNKLSSKSDLFLFHAYGVVRCYNLMMTHPQKQEQKIKTIDLNEFLDGFHNYRTAHNDRDNIHSHPFAVKLRSHLNARAQTCFTLQAFTPHSRSSARRAPSSRYENGRTGREESGNELENINLDEFVHAVLGRERQQEGEQAHQFMRSLNGTWFQGTPEHFKCTQIYNTLGIKKSRSTVRPKTQRYNPQMLRDRVGFTKEVKLSGLFPSRKTHLRKTAKSPTAHAQKVVSPSRNEGSLKYQIVKSIKNQMEKPSSKGSVRVQRNIFAQVGSPLNNQKIAQRQAQAIVKGRRIVIYE